MDVTDPPSPAGLAALTEAEQAMLSAWRLAAASKIALTLGAEAVTPPLPQAQVITLAIPPAMPHHEAAGRLQTLLTPAKHDAAIVALDFAPAPCPADPGNDFDPALFDLGFVRLRPPMIPGSDAPHKDHICYYGKSSMLPSLDWLAAPSGDNIIGFTQMGKYGRFGNQLFQWAFLALYGLRNQCRIAADPWVGCEIFGTQSDPYLPDQRPVLSFPQIGGTEGDLWTMTPALKNIDFLGFFQVIPPILRQHRHLLRLIFTPKPSIAQPLADWLAAQVAPDETLVGIHVRRGDYVVWGEKVGMFRPIPAAWFANSLRQIWHREAKPRLILASDDAEAAKIFAEFSPLVIPPDLVPPHLDYYPDFYGLTRCHILLVANSSYSRMAALLAPDDSAFLVANFDRGGFEPYHPWQDVVFWDRFWGNSDWEIHERGYRV